MTAPPAGEAGVNGLAGDGVMGKEGPPRDMAPAGEGAAPGVRGFIDNPCGGIKDVERSESSDNAFITIITVRSEIL